MCADSTKAPPLSHSGLRRFFPARRRIADWTFGFESFNKIIKAGAQRSNFQNETLSLMQYWSMWSARELVKRRRQYLSISARVWMNLVFYLDSK